MGDYANRVFAVVRRIPRGKVATYGQVARLIGAPRTARYVGYALHANPEPGTDPGCIPCHRVVFKDGRMATGFAFGGPDEQRGMLAAEGIAFDEEGRPLMEEFQWDGRPESAGAPGNAHVTGDSGAADRKAPRPARTTCPPARPRTSTGKPSWPSTRCTIARPAPRRAPTARRNAAPRPPSFRGRRRCARSPFGNGSPLAR